MISVSLHQFFVFSSFAAVNSCLHLMYYYYCVLMLSCHCDVSGEFKTYFEHVRNLRFEDKPDYELLKRLFRELFFRKGFSYDNMFDWELLALPTAQRALLSHEDPGAVTGDATGAHPSEPSAAGADTEGADRAPIEGGDLRPAETTSG